MSFLLGKSCSEIKSFSPKVSSGSYVIDPDGEGGCESIIVFCNMTDKNGAGVTVIGHDSEKELRLVDLLLQEVIQKRSVFWSELIMYFPTGHPNCSICSL